MTHQTPSLGRIVLVRGPLIDPSDPYVEKPAIITKVWGDTNVSLDVFGSTTCAELEGVKLNDDMLSAVSHAAWRWPPYVPSDAKSAPTVEDRVRAERLEMIERYQKLIPFFTTATFKELSVEHQKALHEQEHGMSLYIRALTERVSLLAVGL